MLSASAGFSEAARFAVACALCSVLVGAFGCDLASADGGQTTLVRVADLVGQASRVSGTERSALVDEALANLRADPSVGDSDWLREPLASTPPDLAVARERLAAAIDGLRDPIQTSPPANAQLILARVLDDSRFHPRALLDWLPTFLVPVALLVGVVAQFVWSIIRWPFDRAFDLLILILNSRFFGPFIVLAALGVAAGVFALYRVGLRSILVTQAEATATANDVPLTASEALAEAQRLESLAKYREACHFVLIATLLWIEEKGLARFNRSATNREHLTQLAEVAGLANGQVVGALRPVINRFDRVWYGQPIVSDVDYQELVALAGRVRDVLS